MDCLQKILEVEASLTGSGGLFEVQEEDVLGERMEVFKNRPSSVHALIEASAGFGDKDYIVYNDRRITFSDHIRAVASVAHALRDKYEVGEGDRVAIFAANNPEWIVTFWAAVTLGAIPVGMNGWWVADEILYALNDCQPKVLIGDKKRLARLEGVPVTLPVVQIESGFQELWNYNTDATLCMGPVLEDDPACVIYSAGTTGRPKGVVFSHRNLIAFVSLQAFHGLRMLLYKGINPPESPGILLTNPLFHVSGLLAAFTGLANGVKIVLMEGRFDPLKAMDIFRDEGITSWGLVATLGHRFVNHPDVTKYDFSGVSNIICGGAPMSKELQDRLREVFPAAIDNMGLSYGSTECTGFCTINFGEEFRRLPHTSGRPLPTVQIEIRDLDNKTAGEGVDGEIYIRAPTVMLEYWRQPEATAQTLLPGRWLRTGDIGRIEDGHLVINTRARDLILRGGENIFPIEIELCLLTHQKVAEAAVVGVDHEELGQEVKAYVVPKPNETLDTKDLAEWVGRFLAGFKVPAHWEIRSTPLPKNAVGKVMKHLLDETEQGSFVED